MRVVQLRLDTHVIHQKNGLLTFENLRLPVDFSSISISISISIKAAILNRTFYFKESSLTSYRPSYGYLERQHHLSSCYVCVRIVS